MLCGTNSGLQPAGIVNAGTLRAGSAQAFGVEAAAGPWPAVPLWTSTGSTTQSTVYLGSGNGESRLGHADDQRQLAAAISPGTITGSGDVPHRGRPRTDLQRLQERLYRGDDNQRRHAERRLPGQWRVASGIGASGNRLDQTRVQKSGILNYTGTTDDQSRFPTLVDRRNRGPECRNDADLHGGGDRRRPVAKGRRRALGALRRQHLDRCHHHYRGRASRRLDIRLRIPAAVTLSNQLPAPRSISTSSIRRSLS